jgi:GH25 family lysozyme M1 (1,4-beta-N-acetylmuramidase)
MRRHLILAAVCAAILVGCGGHSPHTSPVAPQPTTNFVCKPTRFPPQLGECVAQYYKTIHRYTAIAPHAVAGKQGVDVSRWQGYPSWPTAKRSGLAFVFNQATYSDTFTDENFDANTIRERQDGIPTAPYVYVLPGCAEPYLVADRFVSTVRSGGGFTSLPPIIDQENDGCLPHDSQIADWDCALAQDIRHDDGWNTVLMYTSPGLWPGGTTCGDYLWLADWGSFQLPSGWASAVAQQYCGVGCYWPGIEGPVDRDVSYGVLSLGRQPTPPKPSPAALKHALNGDYRLRSELRRLEGRPPAGHECRPGHGRHVVPDDKPYKHACSVWLIQGQRVDAQIKALHRKDIY